MEKKDRLGYAVKSKLIPKIRKPVERKKDFSTKKPDKKSLAPDGGTTDISARDA